MSKTRGCGKLSVIKNLFRRLDDSFKNHLKENSNSLFRLLEFEDADMLSGFLESVLGADYYNHVHHVFKFEDHTLGVTLEDVLYLTGLPIQGKPVIFPNSPDLDAYERVFGAGFREKTTLSFHELSEIVVNANEEMNRRKIAVLLILCAAFIAPSNNKHEVSAAYVQFVENVDEIDTFAWGAALLSCIYHGIARNRIDKKNSIDGNMWVVLGFFFIWLPKLQGELGVDLRNYPQPVIEGAPLLPWIVAEIKKKTRNHYAKYNIGSLMPLLNEDIIWTPYKEMQCPRPGDLDGVRDIVPLFCFNYVRHHMPHLCSKQFPEFEAYDVNSIKWEHYKIPFKHRKGGLPQKYLKLHERQINEWNARKAAETYMTANEREEEEREDRNDYDYNSETEDRDDREGYKTLGCF